MESDSQQTLVDSQLNGTPAQILSDESDVMRMKQSLVDERAAPELLAYEGDLVDRLRSMVGHQEEVIRHLQIRGADSELVRTIYVQELNRVKYMMRSYLRCRLLKVEKFVMHVLDNEAEQDKLSPQELHHAQEYFILFGKHMKSSVLRHLPPEFNQLAKQSTASESRDMIPQPDLTAHVFCQVLTDCGPIELDDHGLETADFEKNDLYVVQYKHIKEKLQDRYVQLI